jgi:flotillin
LKQINITAAEAEVAKQEKEIEIRERKVAVTEKELQAQITKKAEAEKSAAMLQAEAALYAKQKQSDAALYERQKKAEAEKYEQERSADADRYGQEQKAVAIKTMAVANYESDVNKAKGLAAIGEAEGRASKLKGEGDAAATKAKGLAEAEALDKKADAMAKYGDAAKQDMQLDALKTYFAALPAIAASVAKPMENIDSITMYGEGNTAKLTGDITKTISQITNGLTDSLGINPTVLLSSLMGSKLAGVGKDVVVPTK